MAAKKGQDDVEQAADAVAQLLEGAVRATLASPTPEHTREAIGRLVDLDHHTAPDDESGPGQMLALLTLVRWLSLARDRLADSPQRGEEVLGWIEAHLGRRYRVRARYVIGALETPEAAEEMLAYSDALREDFLPALGWAAAGTVAVYGGSDMAWLRELEQAAR